MHTPSNIPDHYYLGLRVTAGVNAATPPHTHGGAAIVATMIKGKMLNQMVCPDEDPSSQGSGPKVYSAGESWYEPPGCHHVRSENVGDDEAEFLAVFVVAKQKVDTEGIKSLVVIDAEVEEAKQAKA
jgi:quercetin dioxygenase-like cupin family protein